MYNDNYMFETFLENIKVVENGLKHHNPNPAQHAYIDHTRITKVKTQNHTITFIDCIPHLLTVFHYMGCFHLVGNRRI